MGAWRSVVLVVVAVLGCGCPPAKPRCEGVECGATSACNPASGRCEPLPACSGSGACDAGTCIDSVCSACDSNVLCTAGLTTCDSTTGRCGSCRSAADCAMPTPFCAGARGCVECSSDADCGAGVHCGSEGRCGACQANEDCGPGGTCRLERCIRPCPSDGGSCPAATPVCTIFGCEQCESSSDCSPTEACYRGVCGPATPGETCPTAIDLPFSSGSVLVQGSFVPYGTESNTGSALEADVFFRIDVTQESALNYDLTLEGGFFTQGGAAVFSSCSGGITVAGGASARDAYVVPGTYWIRVYRQSGSGFTLHVWSTPASRIVGNHCLAPVRLTLDANGHAATTGDTRTVPAMSTSTCPTRPATPKLVYDVEVGALSNVRATLHPLDPTFSPSLEMKLTCDGPLKQCVPGLPGADRVAQLDYAEPGHVTVQVSELAGTSGPFELAVDVSPLARNTSCQTATPLTFTGGTATARGLQYAERGDCACFAMDCGNGKQLWRFSTVGLGERSLSVRLVPDGNAAPAGFSVITRCAYADDTAVVACGTGMISGPRSLDVPRLPEGDYFIEVGQSAGPFTLEVALAASFPQPPNDSCTGAEMIDVSSGAASATGDTRGAALDTPSYCSTDPNPGDGRDVVYRLQAGQRGRATVTVVPGDPAFDPTLHLLDLCSSGSTGDPCANDGGVGEAEVLSLDLKGTPRFLWVKGAHQTSGTFQLQASFTPGPANDTCAAATMLTLPQTLTGTTSGAFHDFNQCDSLPSGPDVFYRFTYTASNNGTVNVTLTPSGFDARLYVLTTSCTATSCTRLVNDAGVGMPETLALPVSRNVTYYLGVDGDDGGTFTLSLQ